MIYYDSHRWWTLIKFRGSVFPKAALWALPSALLAFSLKHFEHQGFITLDILTVLTQGDIYSGFTYVLGFSLVFRTSQSYYRYWTAATSVHVMASEWSDSCASLIAFASVAEASASEVLVFRHTVVRLFSLLHAMALSEITSIEADIPLLDVRGLSHQHLLLLTAEHSQGRKVQIVLSWIKAYITQCAARGLLTVPAPILTRVFQELGAGLVHFHSAQQVVIWPFPFPYTQMNVLLVQVYTVITPLVISTWETYPWVCAIFTFISVTCMVGLDIIASELENPFGDDPNDLPVVELQADMNKLLAMLLNPAIVHPPHLTEDAETDYRTLIINSRERVPTGSSPARHPHGDGLRAQMIWCGDITPDAEMSRLHQWLECAAPRTDRTKIAALNTQGSFPSEAKDGEEEYGGRMVTQLHRLNERRSSRFSEVISFPGDPRCEDVNEDAHARSLPCDDALRASPRVSREQDPAPDLRPGWAINEWQGKSQLSEFWKKMFEVAQKPKEGASAADCELPERPQSMKLDDLPNDHLSGWGRIVHLDRAPTTPATYSNKAPTTPAAYSNMEDNAVDKHKWDSFLEGLHQELREHLDNQLEMQRQELCMLESMLLNRTCLLKQSQSAPLASVV